MQSTLLEHILRLEHKIQELRDKLTAPGLSSDERQNVQLAIQPAQLAIECYLKAFETERKIA